MGKFKKTSVVLDSTEEYIEMLNGFFGLTDMEISVLAQFVNAKRGIERRGQDIDPFAPGVKKSVSKRLRPDHEDHYWLGEYIKRLKEKGALLPTEEHGRYTINELLVPGEEDAILIGIDWDTNHAPDS